MLCTVCGKCGKLQEIAGYLREQCGISWIAREHQERVGNRRENTDEKVETLGNIRGDWERSRNSRKDTLAKLLGETSRMLRDSGKLWTHCGTLGNIKER